MYRVTKDIHHNFWYLHKKFLWKWVKVSTWNGYRKSNCSHSIKSLHTKIKHGKLDFSLGEESNYFLIIDRYNLHSMGFCDIEYFKNEVEFTNKYAEYLI